MSDCEEKIDNEQLKEILNEEKIKLLDVSHRVFWNSLFIDAYTVIGFNNYKSTKRALSYYIVKDSIDRFLMDLGKRYNLEITMQKESQETEYRIKFRYLNEAYFSDSIIISIGCAAIEIRMLSGLFIENFLLEDYEIMELLLSEVCRDLYENEKLADFLYEHLRIEESDQNLTLKTVEIAQSSIKAIFDSRKESPKNLEQKYLYSVLDLQGKRIRVLHKEFLEMPEELMKELGKI